MYKNMQRKQHINPVNPVHTIAHVNKKGGAGRQ